MMKRLSPDALHWYVGCVRSCQEKRVASSLRGRGLVCYLPLRREVRRWSDRRKVVESLLIPRYVFLRCNETQRIAVLKSEPRIWGFMASEGRPSVVGDEEMEAFIKMVENGRPVRLAESGAVPGDRVRVTSGPLAGVECQLVGMSGNRCLAVQLGQLGTALMDLELDSVELI